MTNKYLYRVWLGWSNVGDGNRHEVLRILAYSYAQAEDFAKQEMLIPEFRDSVDDEDFGFSWDEKPDECECDDTEDHICYTHYYVELEEIKDYTDDDLRLRLLTNTLGSQDAFHDLTTE